MPEKIQPPSEGKANGKGPKATDAKIQPLVWGAATLAESFGKLLSPALLSLPLPPVPRVDCGDCRRVREGNAEETIRCCDIVPRLPNFLVGEILHHSDHPVILEWIEQRRCDPYYFLPPPAMEERYLSARSDGHFGLPCPLLLPNQGRCSIYAQRPALCIGYHCYVPDVLWREAWMCLLGLLNLLQHAVARVLVQRAGFSMKKMAQVWEDSEAETTLWEGDRQKSSAYRAFWQEHEGKEADFFRGCFVRVRAEGRRVREEASDLQKRLLWSRLATTGALTSEREERWLRPFEIQEIHPEAPPEMLRRALQKGAQEADMLAFSIEEMEGFMAWYLGELQSPSWWRWWSKRSEQRLF